MERTVPAPVASDGRRRPAWLLQGSLVALVLFWGLAFVAIKQALVHVSWITLTFLRFAVADAFFVAYLAAHRNPRPARPARKDLLALTALGFLGFTGYHLFLNLGEAYPDVTAGTAALIIASVPAFIAILAIPVLKERVTLLRAAGIALAFAGLAIMIFLAQPGSEFAFRVSGGALAVLPSALFAALYTVLGKSLLGRYPPFAFVAYTILLGTLLTLPLVLAVAPEFLSDIAGMGWDAWAPVLYLGFFPTFLAYGIWFRILTRMPAAAAGAYLYLSTLVAIVSGILVLGEGLTGAGILGGALVIAGVVLAQRRRKR